MIFVCHRHNDMCMPLTRALGLTVNSFLIILPSSKGRLQKKNPLNLWSWSYLIPHRLTQRQLWLFENKLDGVGPVDNIPSTDKLHHFVQKNKICDMWHVTCDMRHVTCDMWYVTCCGGWTFSQNFSSLALPVSDLWYYKDLEEKAHRLN